MPYRTETLTTGEYYHVFNRSIAHFRIFENPNNCKRFVHSMPHYQIDSPGERFARSFESLKKRGGTGKPDASILIRNERLVDIVAYCIMPTHIHILLKQLTDNGISRFMGNIQNSYTRYFNLKHTRNGPLWSGRFKSILVNSQDYLAHLTCYIHLNPVSAGLVKHPQAWPHSSYREYCDEVPPDEKICSYDGLFDMNREEYQQFVEGRINGQKEVERIKHLILE